MRGNLRSEMRVPSYKLPVTLRFPERTFTCPGCETELKEDGYEHEVEIDVPEKNVTATTEVDLRNNLLTVLTVPVPQTRWVVERDEGGLIAAIRKEPE